VRDLCAATGLPRSTYYRMSRPPVATDGGGRPRPSPRRKLSKEERRYVLELLNQDRFVDKAPAEVFATLLDEGIYLCSIRTMYRILKENKQVRERRDLRRHPKYQKPELLATAPNQIWSWDITRLKGPVKGQYYYLYVLLDIFSRYVVGWMVAHTEKAALAKILIEEAVAREAIEKGSLVVHSDRGSPMTAITLSQKLDKLGIGQSFSRPHVCNDNPYSESQFKTLKLRPQFPKRFGCIEEAIDLCHELIHWYNNEHYHSGIALMTPAMVHLGVAEECNRARQRVLHQAYGTHPERFVRGQPAVEQLPRAAWINAPENWEAELDRMIAEEEHSERGMLLAALKH